MSGAPRTPYDLHGAHTTKAMPTVINIGLVLDAANDYSPTASLNALDLYSAIVYTDARNGSRRTVGYMT
jgi:hypothetical protein